MTRTRRTGALAALALTLVLGACSTPADVAVPGLEAQFGTDGNDYGSDVTLTSSGSLITLSSETGSMYVDTEYANGYADYEKIHWDRYDKNGNFVSQTVLDSTDCLYEDVEFYGTKDYCETTLTPKTIVADAKGFTYALALYSKYAWEYDVDQDLNEFRYYIYKVDASGNLVGRTTLADDRGNGGGTSVDIAVDASGNIYVAGSLRNAYGEVKNFTAKYSTTGSLLWQRTSPVGMM